LRHEPEGVTKIAAGRTLVSWAMIERGAAPKVIGWPDEMRKAMLARVDEQGVALKKLA